MLHLADIRDDIGAFSQVVEEITQDEISEFPEHISFSIAVAKHVSLNEFERKLLHLLGDDVAEKTLRHLRIDLRIFLHYTFEYACEIQENPFKVICHTNRIWQRINQLSHIIETQKIEFVLSFRLVNIDIAHTVEIDDDIYLHKIDEATLGAKYPLHETVAITPLAKEHWQNHRVEAVFRCNESPKRYGELLTSEHANVYERRVIEPFLLSGIFEDHYPYATHRFIESPVQNISTIQHYRGMLFDPKMLKSEQLDSIIESYNVLKNAEPDRILQTSIDRFITGKKQPIQHKDKVNHSNWDKIVDYVIALESILLTANANPLHQELSYRFKLNGSTLLSQYCGQDRRMAFNALGNLYAVRSQIVHGGNEKKLSSAVNALIKSLQMGDMQKKHSTWKLKQLTKVIEDWMRETYHALARMPVSERPYRKSGAWEDLLWN